MKICPKCSQTYGDETLNFCLNDGSTLSALRNSPTAEQETQTVVLSEKSKTISKINLKAFFFIFIFLAIPITFFPPYSWELKSKDADKIVCGSRDKNIELPFKNFDFIFNNENRFFSEIELGCRWSPYDFSDKDYYLHRTLLPDLLVLEFALAVFIAFTVHIIIQKLFSKRKKT